MGKKIIIRAYFDGACEPKNPGGIASFGVVVYFGEKRVAVCSGVVEPKRGDKTTNNLAEYGGLVKLLKSMIKAKLHNEDITVYGDSQFVIRQMTGVYEIHSGAYIKLANEAKELLKKFTEIKLVWIPRKENSEADRLSKQAYLREIEKKGGVFNG